MVLAKVIGSVVSTAKAAQLEGLKLVLLEKVGLPELSLTGEHVVAFDAVDANSGELVFYVSGSSARMTNVTQGRPSDATVIAIVDNITIGGAVIYQKDRG